MGLASRLYRGETQFPLIQRRKTFYIVSIVLVLICLGSMVFRGFNVGEEFKGGASFSWPAGNTSVAQARSAIEGLGVDQPTVQTVGRSNGTKDIRVTTGPLTENKIQQVIDGISQKFKVDPNSIDNANVGASWGKQVTNKAIQGLVFFLIAVIIYISIRFEPKMAAAAIVALIHDLILTAGIYSITHFVVTPATVIALLTVLGYSLYDTIVVFDKVEENTRGLAGRSTQTYSEAAELAYFGAKILHPASIWPAQFFNVPVRLLNTMSPSAKGTLISQEAGSVGVKAVAAKDNITAIKIKSSRMLLAYGFLRKIFEVFEKYRTSIDMITTSEVAVSVTIDSDIFLNEIKRELEAFGTVEIDTNQSIVSIVGNEITETKDIMRKVFESVSGIPVRMVSYGGSRHNISLLIPRSYKEQTLKLLNKGLFDL